VSKGQEEAMDLAAAAGISRQAAIVALLSAVGVIFVLTRVLARRSGRRQRTLVNLNDRE
jgi:hypothetical protein